MGKAGTEVNTPTPQFNVNRKPSGGGRQGPGVVKGEASAGRKSSGKAMPKTLKH